MPPILNYHSETRRPPLPWSRNAVIGFVFAGLSQPFMYLVMGALARYAGQYLIIVLLFTQIPAVIGVILCHRGLQDTGDGPVKMQGYPLAMIGMLLSIYMLLADVLFLIVFAFLR